MWGRWRERLVFAVLTAVLACAAPASAQDFFASARDFVIDRSCDAYASIRGRGEPTALEVGASYAARGVNKGSAPTHAYIKVGGANKWVDLGCGHFADGGAASPAGASEAAESKSHGQCLPFFDERDDPVPVRAGGTVDMSPKPPRLDTFDTAVAKACGPVGKSVGRDEFKALLRAHPDVLERIRSFTSGRVYAGAPPARSAEDYLDALTDAWFKAKGFDHIFCGEPGERPGQIGGLHFHGRYLELQRAGVACRMSNFRQNEAMPGVIYTMGVILQRPDGTRVQDARKGYGLTLSAEDLLKVGTRAMAENPTASTDKSQACLLRIADDGFEFAAVFARRAYGIRTFYPDATPNQRGDTPPCAAPLELPPG